MANLAPDEITAAWSQTETMVEAKKELLARIGEAFIQLQELVAHKALLESEISDCKEKIGVINDSLAPAVHRIVGGQGNGNGTYTLDFDTREVMEDDGQVPDKRNGKSGSHD